MNHECNKNNSLGIKGVYIHTQKHNGKIYRYISAQIKINGKRFNLGYFKTVPEALQARNEATIKHHKEYGRLQ